MPPKRSKKPVLSQAAMCAENPLLPFCPRPNPIGIPEGGGGGAGVEQRAVSTFGATRTKPIQPPPVNVSTGPTLIPPSFTGGDSGASKGVVPPTYTGGPSVGDRLRTPPTYESGAVPLPGTNLTSDGFETAASGSTASTVPRSVVGGGRFGRRVMFAEGGGGGTQFSDPSTLESSVTRDTRLRLGRLAQDGIEIPNPSMRGIPERFRGDLRQLQNEDLGNPSIPEDVPRLPLIQPPVAPNGSGGFSSPIGETVGERGLPVGAPPEPTMLELGTARSSVSRFTSGSMQRFPPDSEVPIRRGIDALPGARPHLARYSRARPTPLSRIRLEPAGARARLRSFGEWSGTEHSASDFNALGRSDPFNFYDARQNGFVRYVPGNPLPPVAQEVTAPVVEPRPPVMAASEARAAVGVGESTVATEATAESSLGQIAEDVAEVL